MQNRADATDAKPDVQSGVQSSWSLSQNKQHGFLPERVVYTEKKYSSHNSYYLACDDEYNEYSVPAEGSNCAYPGLPSKNDVETSSVTMDKPLVASYEYSPSGECIKSYQQSRILDRASSSKSSFRNGNNSQSSLEGRQFSSDKHKPDKNIHKSPSSNFVCPKCGLGFPCTFIKCRRGSPSSSDKKELNLQMGKNASTTKTEDIDDTKKRTFYNSPPKNKNAKDIVNKLISSYSIQTSPRKKDFPFKKNFTSPSKERTGKEFISKLISNYTKRSPSVKAQFPLKSKSSPQSIDLKQNQRNFNMLNLDLINNSNSLPGKSKFKSDVSQNLRSGLASPKDPRLSHNKSVTLKANSNVTSMVKRSEDQKPFPLSQGTRNFLKELAASSASKNFNCNVSEYSLTSVDTKNIKSKSASKMLKDVKDSIFNENSSLVEKKQKHVESLISKNDSLLISSQKQDSRSIDRRPRDSGKDSHHSKGSSEKNKSKKSEVKKHAFSKPNLTVQDKASSAYKLEQENEKAPSVSFGMKTESENDSAFVPNEVIESSAMCVNNSSNNSQINIKTIDNSCESSFKDSNLENIHVLKHSVSKSEKEYEVLHSKNICNRSKLISLDKNERLDKFENHDVDTIFIENTIKITNKKNVLASDNECNLKVSSETMDETIKLVPKEKDYCTLKDKNTSKIDDAESSSKKIKSFAMDPESPVLNVIGESENVSESNITTVSLSTVDKFNIPITTSNEFDQNANFAEQVFSESVTLNQPLVLSNLDNYKLDKHKDDQITRFESISVNQSEFLEDTANSVAKSSSEILIKSKNFNNTSQIIEIDSFDLADKKSPEKTSEDIQDVLNNVKSNYDLSIAEMSFENLISKDPFNVPKSVSNKIENNIISSTANKEQSNDDSNDYVEGATAPFVPACSMSDTAENLLDNSLDSVVINLINTESENNQSVLNSEKKITTKSFVRNGLELHGKDSKIAHSADSIVSEEQSELVNEVLENSQLNTNVLESNSLSIIEENEPNLHFMDSENIVSCPDSLMFDKKDNLDANNMNDNTKSVSLDLNVECDHESNTDKTPEEFLVAKKSIIHSEKSVNLSDKSKIGNNESEIYLESSFVDVENFPEDMDVCELDDKVDSLVNEVITAHLSLNLKPEQTIELDGSKNISLLPESTIESNVSETNPVPVSVGFDLHQQQDTSKMPIDLNEADFLNQAESNSIPTVKWEEPENSKQVCNDSFSASVDSNIEDLIENTPVSVECSVSIDDSNVCVTSASSVATVSDIHQSDVYKFLSSTTEANSTDMNEVNTLPVSPSKLHSFENTECVSVSNIEDLIENTPVSVECSVSIDYSNVCVTSASSAATVSAIHQSDVYKFLSSTTEANSTDMNEDNTLPVSPSKLHPFENTECVSVDSNNEDLTENTPVSMECSVSIDDSNVCVTSASSAVTVSDIHQSDYKFLSSTSEANSTDMNEDNTMPTSPSKLHSFENTECVSVDSNIEDLIENTPVSVECSVSIDDSNVCVTSASSVATVSDIHQSDVYKFLSSTTEANSTDMNEDNTLPVSPSKLHSFENTECVSVHLENSSTTEAQVVNSSMTSDTQAYINLSDIYLGDDLDNAQNIIIIQDEDGNVETLYVLQDSGDGTLVLADGATIGVEGDEVASQPTTVTDTEFLVTGDSKLLASNDTSTDSIKLLVAEDKNAEFIDDNSKLLKSSGTDAEFITNDNTVLLPAEDANIEPVMASNTRPADEALFDNINVEFGADDALPRNLNCMSSMAAESSPGILVDQTECFTSKASNSATADNSVALIISNLKSISCDNTTIHTSSQNLLSETKVCDKKISKNLDDSRKFDNFLAINVEEELENLLVSQGISTSPINVLISEKPLIKDLYKTKESKDNFNFKDTNNFVPPTINNLPKSKISGAETAYNNICEAISLLDNKEESQNTPSIKEFENGCSLDKCDTISLNLSASICDKKGNDDIHLDFEALSTVKNVTEYIVNKVVNNLECCEKSESLHLSNFQKAKKSVKPSHDHTSLISDLGKFMYFDKSEEMQNLDLTEQISYTSPIETSNLIFNAENSNETLNLCEVSPSISNQKVQRSKKSVRTNNFLYRSAKKTCFGHNQISNDEEFDEIILLNSCSKRKTSDNLIEHNTNKRLKYETPVLTDDVNSSRRKTVALKTFKKPFTAAKKSVLGENMDKLKSYTAVKTCVPKFLAKRTALKTVLRNQDSKISFADSDICSEDQNLKQCSSPNSSDAQSFFQPEVCEIRILPNDYLKRASSLLLKWKKNEHETQDENMSDDETKCNSCCTSPIKELMALKTPCTCTAKEVPCLCNNEPLQLTCEGEDSIDNNVVPCSNNVSQQYLLTPSSKVKHRAFCDIHLQRLHEHHCCPKCGVFCTQGEFLMCSSEEFEKKRNHLFHVGCFLIPAPGLPPTCPHCCNFSSFSAVNLICRTPDNFDKEVPSDFINITKRINDYDIFMKKNTAPKVVSVSDSVRFLPQSSEMHQMISALATEKTLRLRPTGKCLYNPIRTGDVQKVMQLIGNGVNPNHKFKLHSNNTPLHVAAYYGNIGILHILIQAGASIDSLNDDLETPLIVAVERNQLPIVRYLINAGTQIDVKDCNGMTSFHIACKNGYKNIAEYLYNTGRINVNLQDDGGWTPLVWSCEHKHLDLVKWLLDVGANPNVRDNEENTVLHWAAYSGESGIAELFLKKGCPLSYVNNRGDSALHIAAREDNFECVKLLVNEGAVLDQKNKSNQTPIMCCEDSSASFSYLMQAISSGALKIRKSQLEKHVVFRDISRGAEYFPIQAINEVDEKEFVMEFTYVTKNCYRPGVEINNVVNNMQICCCQDDCLTHECSCTKNAQCGYDSNGLLVTDFEIVWPPIIYECSKMCHCPKTCSNRVVQRGLRCPLQLFRTLYQGWGVRALQDLPKGAFVCEYVGEVITGEEAATRDDDTYFFDLENKDSDYCLDGKYYGNVSRFLNHSCEPNMIAVKVFVDHQDSSFPRIAFFTLRPIKAFEELCFDYGLDFWMVKSQYILCTCNATLCKYSKDSIDDTLKKYFADSTTETDKKSEIISPLS